MCRLQDNRSPINTLQPKCIKGKKKKLKNIHSCLVLTIQGRAACVAAVLSWPTHSTWPAPLETGHATDEIQKKKRELLKHRVSF